MDIKEALENYNNYNVKIAIIENDIFKLNEEVIECRSSNLDGMPKPKGYVESSFENQIVRKLDKIKELEKEKQELKLEISIIDKLITTLKKNTQEIIRMRYIEKSTIEYIADKKDRTYRAISSILSKALQEMQLQYEKSS